MALVNDSMHTQRSNGGTKSVAEVMVMASRSKPQVFPLNTPQSIYYFNKILHCPDAMTNLQSGNHFCIDNDWFFILTDSYYTIKDNKIRKKTSGGT